MEFSKLKTTLCLQIAPSANFVTVSYNLSGFALRDIPLDQGLKTQMSMRARHKSEQRRTSVKLLGVVGTGAKWSDRVPDDCHMLEWGGLVLV